MLMNMLFHDVVHNWWIVVVNTMLYDAFYDWWIMILWCEVAVVVVVVVVVNVVKVVNCCRCRWSCWLLLLSPYIFKVEGSCPGMLSHSFLKLRAHALECISFIKSWGVNALIGTTCIIKLSSWWSCRCICRWCWVVVDVELSMLLSCCQVLLYSISW
jgi:hypothetical protein